MEIKLLYIYITIIKDLYFYLFIHLLSYLDAYYLEYLQSIVPAQMDCTDLMSQK